MNMYFIPVNYVTVTSCWIKEVVWIRKSTSVLNSEERRKLLIQLQADLLGAKIVSKGPRTVKPFGPSLRILILAHVFFWHVYTKFINLL